MAVSTPNAISDEKAAPILHGERTPHVRRFRYPISLYVELWLTRKEVYARNRTLVIVAIALTCLPFGYDVLTSASAEVSAMVGDGMVPRIRRPSGTNTASALLEKNASIEEVRETLGSPLLTSSMKDGTLCLSYRIDDANGLSIVDFCFLEGRLTRLGR